jgi:membrane protein implicated in regulation of membrane protease activity
MLVIEFLVIVGLDMAAIGVVLVMHGANVVFMVIWFTMLLVITVVNVRKQVRRRQAMRMLRTSHP